MSFEIVSPTINSSNNYDFAVEVLHGLNKKNKAIDSKYLYDEIGCGLYNEVTSTNEYYLTNKEKYILEKHGEQIASSLHNAPFNLIELGPGEGIKTKILIKNLRGLRKNFTYVPIDIAHEYINQLGSNFLNRFHDLPIKGVVADYFMGLNWLKQTSRLPNVVLFLGSSIGNFDTRETKKFLHSLWHSLNNNDIVIIGFDLVKNTDILRHAYNDCEHIVAKFSLNILSRINRELNGDFDLNQFYFNAPYDALSSMVNMYIISKIKQKTYIKDIHKGFDFEAHEAIWIGRSKKYKLSDVNSLAHNAGFEVMQHFFDDEKYFLDSMWRVKKD